MQWAMLALTVLGLIILSSRHPKSAFGILGVLLLSGATVLWQTSDRGGDVGRVDATNIKVKNTAVTPAYAGSYRLSGRLLNQHKQVNIRKVMLRIDLLDCADANQAVHACLVVGQTTEMINTDIPAGQARDFAINIYLGEPLISGMINWRFEVTEARR